jgi:hypothetical protein
MRILSVVAAMLYVGPFLAGLMAAPIGMLPVFLAIFMLWVIILRPSVWAKATAGGTPVALALHLGGLTLVQALLVMVSFGLGRGLAMLVGGTIDLPVWLPALLSLAALPVGRLVWTPEAEYKAFAEEARRALGDDKGDER